MRSLFIIAFLFTFFAAIAQETAGELKEKANGFAESEQYDSALVYYQKALVLKPKWDTVYYNISKVLAAQRKFEAAVDSVSLAIKYNPNVVFFHSQRALYYEELGWLDKAIEEYDFLIKLEFTNPDHYINRGMVYFDKDEYIKAKLDLNRALKYDPQNFKAYYFLSLIAAQENKFDKEVEYLTKAIKLKGDDPDLYFERGLTYQILENYNAALADIDKAISMNHDEPDYYSAKAMVLFHGKGLEGEAFRILNKALALDPENINAYYDIAALFAARDDQKSLDSALTIYSWILSKDSAHTDVYYDRAILREHMGDKIGAIKDLDRVIELEPRMPEAYYVKGHIYFDSEDYEAAILQYEKAISVGYDNAEVYMSIGSAYNNIEDYQEALKYYNKAILLDPENWHIYINRANTKELLGDKKGAKDDRKKAKEFQNLYE